MSSSSLATSEKTQPDRQEWCRERLFFFVGCLFCRSSSGSSLFLSCLAFFRWISSQALISHDSRRRRSFFSFLTRESDMRGRSKRQRQWMNKKKKESKDRSSRSMRSCKVKQRSIRYEIRVLLCKHILLLSRLFIFSVLCYLIQSLSLKTTLFS